MEKPNPLVRLAKVVAGLTLLPIGVALFFLPGPGLLVVACSLLLLENEFRWAGQLRESMTSWAQRGANWIQEKASRQT